MKKLQVGGSVSQDSAFYIEREADMELLTALQQNELCYVFNSRQMGKSSLLLRVKSQLTDAGSLCCFVDLSRIGNVGVTIEQWYAGIISELWRGFALPAGHAMLDWWSSMSGLSPAHKFDSFLAYLLAAKPDAKQLVVFFDEVDSTLSLPFSADDFFAIIRGAINRRADEADFQRITFALFGVATPVDLVQDPTRSPFNIGRAIRLEGFTVAEAQPLARAFAATGCDAEALLEQVIDWTGGQPFLTQKLCQLALHEMAEGVALTDPAGFIEHLVQQQILTNWESQDNPEHLRSIRDRLMTDEQYNVQLLADYRAILAAPQQEVCIDLLANSNRLYLTGLIALTGKLASPRNRIYRTIFDLDWVDQQRASICPFHQKLQLWLQTDGQDAQWLLSEHELASAKAWAQDRFLSDTEHRFLAASEALVNEQVKAWNVKLELEIQQRKTAEQQLKHMVLAHDQAKQEAEAANKAKTDFLARISHEVRTHLNSITGLAYISQQREGASDNRGNLHKIATTAKSMLNIMNDIVDINKIEAGQLEIHQEEFFVDDVVDHVLDTVAYAVSEKQLVFGLQMPAQPMNAIVSDPSRLEQILSNLIISALERTVDGNISLEIRCLSLSTEQVELNFQVTDSGRVFACYPILHDQLAEAFEVFTLDVNFKLAYQLAELLGGQINIHQNPAGSGSRIEFMCRFQTSADSWVAPQPVPSYLVEQGLYQQADHHFLNQSGYELVIADLHAPAAHHDSQVLLIDLAGLTQRQALTQFLQANSHLAVLLLLQPEQVVPAWLEAVAKVHQLQLPCSAKRLAEMLRQSAADIVAEPPLLTAQHAQVNVLLAEDDEINQQIIAELLSSLNLEVRICHNGKDAYQALLEESFDVVLMDIEMPVMDGVTAVAKIRAQGQQAGFEKLATIPIIAMTAHVLLGDKKRFLAAGMNDYLSKPIDPYQLIRTLNDWLANVQLQPAVTKQQRLPQVAGIDIEAGVKRCGDNVELYNKLLAKFAHKYATGVTLTGGDLAVAVHTLKGSAANLGIHQVAQQAAKFEQMDIADHESTELALLNLSKLLKQVCLSIRQQHI